MVGTKAFSFPAARRISPPPNPRAQLHSPKHHHRTTTTSSERVLNLRRGPLGLQLECLLDLWACPLLNSHCVNDRSAQHSALGQIRQHARARLAPLIPKGWQYCLTPNPINAYERPDNLNSIQNISSGAKFGLPALTSSQWRYNIGFPGFHSQSTTHGVLYSQYLPHLIRNIAIPPRQRLDAGLLSVIQLILPDFLIFGHLYISSFDAQHTTTGSYGSEPCRRTAHTIAARSSISKSADFNPRVVVRRSNGRH